MNALDGLDPSLCAARKLWKDYFATIDGIVYIVDALDQSRFPEAKKELDVSHVWDPATTLTRFPTTGAVVK
jgi:hypothetical protein